MAALDESETYASAALFTLALYSSQVEVGIDRFQENAFGEYRPSTWGCPPDLDLDEVLFGELLSQDHLTHFWGWDCCGRDGLCQSVYSNLCIPRKRWTGLLKIPETVGDMSTDGGIDELIHIVERYSQMLDPELKYTKGTAVEFFSVQRQRSIDVGELDIVAAGLVNEDEHDTPIKRSESTKLAEIAEDIVKPPPEMHIDASPPSEPNGDVEKRTWPIDDASEVKEKPMPRQVSVFASEAQDVSSSDEGAYEAYIDGLKDKEFDVDEKEDVVIPKVGFTPRSDYHHPAAGASCLALRALIKAALLDAALANEGERDARIQWLEAEGG